jgi:hypothetical protein
MCHGVNNVAANAEQVCFYTLKVADAELPACSELSCRRT